jgi:hypothetical protein
LYSAIQDVKFTLQPMGSWLTSWSDYKPTIEGFPSRVSTNL